MQDVVTIQSDFQVLKAEIYDVNGRVLFSKAVKDNKVNVAQLAKGTYVVKFFTKEGSQSVKMIKN